MSYPHFASPQISTKYHKALSQNSPTKAVFLKRFFYFVQFWIRALFAIFAIKKYVFADLRKF